MKGRECGERLDASHTEPCGGLESPDRLWAQEGRTDSGFKGTLSWLPLEGQSVQGEGWSLGTRAEASILVQVKVEEGRVVSRIRIDFEGIACSIG